MTNERVEAGQDVVTLGAVEAGETVGAVETMGAVGEGHGDRAGARSVRLPALASASAPAFRWRTAAYDHGPTTTVPVIPLWDRLPTGVC
jgi:hypothetical protein